MTKRVARPKPGEPIRVVTTKAGEARYRVTIDTARTGERRRQRTSTHDTLTEARRYVERVRTDVARGVYTEPARLAFDSLAKEYLRRVERGDHGRKAVRPRTLDGYREALARVAPLIGSRPVDSLTYADIAAMVDALSVTYSRASVAKTLGLVRSVLGYGVRHHGLARNAAEGISPKGAAPVERKAYTPSEIRALSRSAEADRLGGVFAVVLLGLRLSEALGLTWADVDLAGAKLTVQRSRTWRAGGYVDGEPKTRRGARVVTLDPTSLERLRAMRAAHAAERLRLGVGLTEGDVLACHEDGTPLRPEALMRSWRDLCKRAEVESLGLHSARHSAVKVLREAGLPDAVIAQRLGHSEAVMASVYGAPFTHQQDAAAAVLGRLLG